MFNRMVFGMFTPLLEKVLVGKSFCLWCVKWPLVKSYNQMIALSFNFSFFPNKSHLVEEFEKVAIRCNWKFEKIKSPQCDKFGLVLNLSFVQDFWKKMNNRGGPHWNPPFFHFLELALKLQHLQNANPPFKTHPIWVQFSKSFSKKKPWQKMAKSFANKDQDWSFDLQLLPTTTIEQTQVTNNKLCKNPNKATQQLIASNSCAKHN